MTALRVLTNQMTGSYLNKSQLTRLTVSWCFSQEDTASAASPSLSRLRRPASLMLIASSLASRKWSVSQS